MGTLSGVIADSDGEGGDRGLESPEAGGVVLVANPAAFSTLGITIV